MASAPFSLTLFGPFEARYEDQPITNFATDKIRALLAYLAIESNKPHRRDSLAALLWPNYSNETALRNLRQSLYRLRQTLQKVDSDLPDQLITQDRLTITLNAQAISLDVSRFTQSIQAVKLSEEPFPHLEQIVTYYRGSLLQGISITGAYAFEEWLNIQREVFHQQAVDAFIRFLAIHETRGDYDAILSNAPKLLALEPWHEETHRQIIRAHYQKGNRSRAITQYQDLKNNMLSELGLEPSPATTALIKQIETDPDSIASIPPKVTPAKRVVSAEASYRHQIPTPSAPIIGRQTELNYIIQTLQDSSCRLLTITGPGGIGKTRLSIEVAHRLSTLADQFSNGVYFISLAQIEHGHHLPLAIAQALGITLKSRTKPQQELIKYLQNQECLLFLDNFEHLLSNTDSEALSTATSIIVDILATAPNVTLLVTSRDPLAIQSEWVYPIEGLPYTIPDSRPTANILDEAAPQLFIQNARRYNISFDPSDNTDAILEICRLTDGLPLAIEIAATWMRVYTCQEIVQSISHSLDFLTSPFRDVPARQRSIRVILDSTWEQLTAEQQNTLMTLSAFRGGFTIQAALFVTEAQILDLSILVAKSLLRRNDNNRYFLHELVKQFSREKLSASENEYKVRERHARFYLADLAEQTKAFSGANPVDAIDHIRQDLDNLRTAWDWSASHANLSLLEMGMKGFAQFWVFTGTNLEGESAIQKAIDHIQNIPQEPLAASVHSYLLSSLAWLQMGTGKNDEADKNLQAALELAKEGNNIEMRATALSLQGWLLQNRGQLVEAEIALNESCSIFEQIDNQFQLSLALIRTGSIFWWSNELNKSLEYYERSLHIEQKLGNKRGINRAYGGLGMAYMDLENFEPAMEYLEKSLQLDRELGNRPGTIRNLGHLGNIYLRKGKYDLAIARYQEALEIEQKTDSKNTSAIWLCNLGNVHKQLKDHKTALDYYDQSITFAKETNNDHQLCETLLGKADIFLQENRLEDAHSLIEESLAISYEVDRKDAKLQGIILKARWYAQTGEHQKARQLLESSRETLASEYKEDETKARLFYELWKIDHSVEDAQESLTLYESCQERAEQIEYTERITELLSFLKDHS